MTWIARFYKHGDLTGSYVEISSIGKDNGYSDLNNQNANNEFSSAEVKPGYRARAFVDLNFTGQELRLDKDPQFGRANYISGPDGIMRFTYFPDASGFKFNDNISSVYCEPYMEEVQKRDWDEVKETLKVAKFEELIPILAGPSWGEAYNGSSKKLMVYGPKNGPVYDTGVYLLAPGLRTPSGWDCDGFFLPSGAKLLDMSPSGAGRSWDGPAAIKYSDWTEFSIRDGFPSGRFEVNVSPTQVLRSGDVNWYIPSWTQTDVDAIVGPTPVAP
jgi:hypothetical protein